MVEGLDPVVLIMTLKLAYKYLHCLDYPRLFHLDPVTTAISLFTLM
jgi:hypothetical protein